MASKQLFLAIPPSPELLDLVASIQSQKVFTSLPLSWESPYLQIASLGRISKDQLPAVKNTISKLILAENEINISINFLSTLYKRHENSLLILDVHSPTLEDFYRKLHSSLKTLTISLPNRLSLFIVLAKFDRVDPQTTKDYLSKVSSIELNSKLEIAVRKFELIEQLSHKNSIHLRRVHSFAIGRSSYDLQTKEFLEPATPDILLDE